VKAKPQIRRSMECLAYVGRVKLSVLLSREPTARPFRLLRVRVHLLSRVAGESEV
jgi:hypothetical protein